MLENLIVQETQYTPYIDLNKDTNKIVIRGKSYPENTFEFYEPMLTWMKEFIKHDENKKLDVTMEIIYFNSSSSKIFFDLFDILFEASKKMEVNIIWLCDEENECAIEAGEDFKEDFEELNFNITFK